MSHKFVFPLFLISLFFMFGCMEVSPDDQEYDNEIEQEIGNTYDIGIIPSSTSCPNGGPLREIHMDDEDNNNKSAVSGWVGATHGPAKTTFRFCRVDGSNFFPLVWASPSNVSAYYAVLKMGPQCPNGSFDFRRNFDNEDNRNANWVKGDIEPSTQSKYGTILHFCLFKYATASGTTMSSFPDFGIQYGVFADHGSSFPLALAKGWVYTDDEDSSNGNWYEASIDWIYDAQRIISGGSNTYLDMARVR